MLVWASFSTRRGEFLDNERLALPDVEVNPPRDGPTRWQSAGGTIEFYEPKQDRPRFGLPEVSQKPLVYDRFKHYKIKLRHSQYFIKIDSFELKIYIL